MGVSDLARRKVLLAPSPRALIDLILMIFFSGIDLLEWLKIDDPVGCFPVHGMAGVWSLISVGLFAETVSINDKSAHQNTTGIFKGGKPIFFGAQLLACLCIIAWAMITNIIEVRLHYK